MTNFTVSIDHIIIEVTSEKGTEIISCRRLNKDGSNGPANDFIKGDKLAGACVLNQIAELIGYGPVAELMDDKDG